LIADSITSPTWTGSIRTARIEKKMSNYSFLLTTDRYSPFTLSE